MRKLYAASMPGGAKSIINFFAQDDPCPEGEHDSVAFWQAAGYDVHEVSSKLVPTTSDVPPAGA